MVYLELFWEFLKIGLFTIGGGLAALPYLYELAGRHDWFTASQVTDMVAIAESTPGPIGVNASTFAGYQAGGIPGGVVATIGFAIPGLIISLIIAKFLAAFHEKPLVKNAFYGLRPAVTALIASAGIQLMLNVFLTGWDREWATLLTAFDIKAIVLFFIAFFTIWKWNKHPIIYIAAAAAIGIIFKF